MSQGKIRSHLLPTAVALLACTRPAHADALKVSVAARDGRPVAAAVVTVEPEAAGFAPATPVHAVMDQLDLAFVPHLLVIPVHSSVQFPNSDAVSHQVYSFSSARQFQLPLYRGKPYPPVRFDQPGVVTLGCNIHDNMLAYIFVTAAPHYGQTDAGGAWTLDGLAPGRYRVRAWHPLLNEPRPPERVVDVHAGAASVVLTLQKALRPAPLDGKPRSWNY
jgi:plastocyanin